MNTHTKQTHIQPIGMFDSGVGGLTVMRQIMRALPGQPIVYFGDTARVPYGNKSPDTITRYSIENVNFLMSHHIKLLVIACNTASSCSEEKLRELFDIPIVGVIEPASNKAVKATINGRIAVLGTRATIQSGAYQRAIHRQLPGAIVTALACPLFVPLVEERFISHAAASLIVKEYLAPLHKQQCDTVVLGCTHYPLLRTLIENELGRHVTIVDSAVTCAEQVAELLGTAQSHCPSSTTPQYQYFVSDDPDKCRAIGRDFLGIPLDGVRLKCDR